MLKKILISAALMLFAIPLAAQTEIGVSYEIRDESPKNGFGARLETRILKGLPIIQLGLRAHFSYFSEENDISSGGLSYSRELHNYDFGVAATGGFSLGLLTPYVGLGLGSETADLKFKDIQNAGTRPEDKEDSAVFWNTFAGAKVTLLPFLKPFVEYRFSGGNLEMPHLSDKSGRVIFGIVLSF